MNPVDQFRHAFYETLLAEQQLKERAQHLKERNCYHKYDTEVETTQRGYRAWECTKCGRITMRRIRA